MKKITLFFGLIGCFLGFGQMQNVTFQVDMNQYSGPFNAVEVFGTFNNFAGGVTIMTDGNSDGVYDVTAPITAGTIEFLFAVDTGTFNYVVESLTPGSPCTLTSGSFTNRLATISADTTYSVVCWEACVDCGNAPTNSDVTFQVDMSQYTGSFTDVNLNGTFNNFCGSCATMTDANNDMIYELTVSVPNDTIEWLFTVDGFTDQEMFTPGTSCTKTTIDGGNTFVNRVFVPSADTTLPDVCWNSCVDCASVGIDENNWIKDFKVTPNPNNGIFDISGSLNSNENIRITVLDMQGRLIYEASDLNSTISRSIDISSSEQGMYILNISSDSNVLTEKIIYAN